MENQDLIAVRIYFANQKLFKKVEPIEHIVAKHDLERFLKATHEYYIDPGVNPHTGVKMPKVKKITVSELLNGGPYWWATPGLQLFDVQDGVKTFVWCREMEVWPKAAVFTAGCGFLHTFAR